MQADTTGSARGSPPVMGRLGTFLVPLPRLPPQGTGQDGDALGHVPHFGYALVALESLGELHQGDKADPDWWSKALGMRPLPPDSHLQPLPAQHLPLHHQGGLCSEQLPHSVRVGACWVGSHRLSALA